MRRLNGLAKELNAQECDSAVVVKKREEGTKVGVAIKGKRQRLTDNQCAIPEAKSPVVRTPRPTPHPLDMDLIMDNVFSYIFPGSLRALCNLKDLYNLRLVSKVWNEAGARLLRKHVWIRVEETLRQAESHPLINPISVDYTEYIQIDQNATRLNQVTRTLSVERIGEFVSLIKKSSYTPFAMYSLGESIFKEKNGNALVHLLQECGPSIKQLVITMEPSTFVINFGAPKFDFSKLKQLSLFMRCSKIEETSALQPYKANQQIHPIQASNGFYSFLQSLCNEATSLQRLDIRWMSPSTLWSSTPELSHLVLPTTITELQLETMSTDCDTVKNILLQKDMKLKTLKWSIGSPLLNLTEDDVTQCLKHHSTSLKSLSLSIWHSSIHRKGAKVVTFPTMPNLEKLFLLGKVEGINQFAFPIVFPKVSVLGVPHRAFDVLDAIPSKTVKYIQIHGFPTRHDFQIVLAKCFPEVESMIMYCTHGLLTKECLIAMFEHMAKLRILQSPLYRSDATVKFNCKSEHLPNGLYLKNLGGALKITKIEALSVEVKKLVAQTEEFFYSNIFSPNFQPFALKFKCR